MIIRKITPEFEARRVPRPLGKSMRAYATECELVARWCEGRVVSSAVRSGELNERYIMLCDEDGEPDRIAKPGDVIYLTEEGTYALLMSDDFEDFWSTVIKVPE